MTPVFGLVLAACTVDLAAGMRQPSKHASQNQSEPVDCEGLSNFTLRGIKVGKAATTVCQKWPASWGPFPLRGIIRAKILFAHGFGEGGLWDQMKELADERSRSTDFCWRAHASPDVNPCFELDTFYNKGLRSKDMPGQDRTQEPTQLWCQRRCALVSGCKHFSYFSADGGCHLEDAEASPHDYFGRRPVAGPPVCPETQSVQSMSQLNASETLVGSGEATWTCPSGFQPSTLIGKFAAVCSSRCEGSKFPVGCGFGCANSRRTCASRVMDQVSEVLSAVGAVAGYLTGNQVISQVVDKVLKLVEFLVTTFFHLVKLGKELWTSYNESDSIASFLTVFVTFILENAQQINQNIETLTSLFGDVTEFWVDMIDAGFKLREPNLDFFISTMDKYGEAVLDGAMGLVSVFVFPECEV